MDLSWPSVTGWLNKGGVMLGITRTIPDENMLQKMAMQLKNYHINACVIAGGQEVVTYV